MTIQKEPALLYPGNYVLLSREWVMWRAKQLREETPTKPLLWAINIAAREGVCRITKDYTEEEKKMLLPGAISFEGSGYYIFSSDWSRLIRYQPGGVCNKHHLARWGEEEAKKQLVAEELKFQACLKEAQLDAHLVLTLVTTSMSKLTKPTNVNGIDPSIDVIFEQVKEPIGRYKKYYRVRLSSGDSIYIRYFITYSGATSYYDFLTGLAPNPERHPETPWGWFSLEELKKILRADL